METTYSLAVGGGTDITNTIANVLFIRIRVNGVVVGHVGCWNMWEEEEARDALNELRSGCATPEDFR